MSGTNLHSPICFHVAMINQTQHLLHYNENLDAFSTEHCISAASLPCSTPEKRPWYAHTTQFFLIRMYKYLFLWRSSKQHLQKLLHLSLHMKFKLCWPCVG